MATTTVRGHVSRALDFFERDDIYMGIGRSTPWTNEANPPAPSTDATELEEVIGYKKLEYCYLVVPDNVNGTISYRDTKWRIVTPKFEALTVGNTDDTATTVKLTSVNGLKVHDKLQIGNYVGQITAIDTVNSTVTMDTPFGFDIPAGTLVKGGALVEGARWVYVEAHLRYDELPLTQYRQIGVFSRLVKNDGVPAGKVALLPNEVRDPGILEVIDNRKVVNRQIDQKEHLSIVIEF